MPSPCAAASRRQSERSWANLRTCPDRSR
jgi:hypothetical protein